MLKKAGIYIGKWLLLVGLMIFVKCSSSPDVDLLLYNGIIHTMNPDQPLAGMVAIKGDRIVHVGEAEAAPEWKEKAVHAIDLKQRTMTPGLIEGHAHFIGLGESMMNLNLMGTQSYTEIVDKVAEAVKTRPPGEWILGRGWHQDKWDVLPKIMVKGYQVHDALSAVSPDHPVVLRHASGHAALVNARAMAIAGITRERVVEGDGEIIKDAHGNPTGIFIENAMDLLSAHIPAMNTEMLRRTAGLAAQECLKNGITSFHDAGAGPEVIALYRELAEAEQLGVRLWVMLSSEDKGVFQEAFLNDWYQRGPLVGAGNNFLTVRSIKLYSDGALGSWGAWLLAPYSDKPGHVGHETLPMETVYTVARDALANGFQVCTHAIGDRANREVLDRYARAFTENPEKAQNSRFRIEHAQHLSEADITRFADMGVIPAMQSIHMSSDRPWAIDRLGKARIEEGAYIWRKLLDSGARIVNGTDSPVEPVNPLANFYAAVSRRTLDGYPPGGFESSQKMTREEALRSYTIDAAYAAFEEPLKGSVEVGKLADFTVFSRDIMTIPEDSLLHTDVTMTIVGGKVAYSGEAPESRAASQGK